MTWDVERCPWLDRTTIRLAVDNVTTFYRPNVDSLHFNNNSKLNLWFFCIDEITVQKPEEFTLFGNIPNQNLLEN